jgi:hypothetical protein
VKLRQRVTDAWCRDVRSGWGERAYRATTEIVEVLARCQAADLHGVGVSLAKDGHQLDDVLAWFRLLASNSRAFRTVLAEGGIVALASGWAEGVLHDDYGTTAVTPLDVLRLRLRQQFELTTSLGEAPGARPRAGGRRYRRPSSSTRRACSITLELTFSTGETMATAPNGNLLVLVHRNPEVRVRTLQLLDAMRHDDQLRGTPVRVWIEPLANTAEHVDSHLLGLAS